LLINVCFSAGINMSLSALGDVIGCLSSGEKFVPYRNNKLTMLLQVTRHALSPSHRVCTHPLLRTPLEAMLKRSCFSTCHRHSATRMKPPTLSRKLVCLPRRLFCGLQAVVVRCACALYLCDIDACRYAARVKMIPNLCHRAASVLAANQLPAASSSTPVNIPPIQQHWPSEIVKSRLWLGDQHNAKSLKRLRELRITHVLNCAGEVLNYWDGETMEMEGAALTYLKLNVQDSTGSNIIPLFDQVWQFLSGALADSRNRVLVHCTSGQSQSAAMLISYIMQQFRWSFDASFEFVVRRKEDIKPSPALVEQLKECVSPASNAKP